MPQTHVIIIDGTLSRLDTCEETNAGLLYKLLSELLPRTDLWLTYHPGIQGEGLLKWVNVAAGVGINLTICAGYSALAKRYKAGDKVLLFGFSRGAYAVRSLAGMIGRIGLLKPEHVTKRRVRRAFRHYENGGGEAFSRAYCTNTVEIEMVGVWDTVKALGLPYPILSRIAPMATEFHDHRLGPAIKNAFHALALDETRTAYKPILWQCENGWQGRVEQLWFAGAHADIGGQIETFQAARPLSNIPLVWMLEKAAICGLPLPDDWRNRFPTDPSAEMFGNRSALARSFIFRAPRKACSTAFDGLHDSVAVRQAAREGYRPKAIICPPE